MIRRNRYLTARQQEILQRLRDLADNDGEGDHDLVQDGVNGPFCSGTERCTRTGWALLRLMLISRDGPGRDDDLIYYRINEAGKKALDDPDYVPPGIAILQDKLKKPHQLRP